MALCAFFFFFKHTLENDQTGQLAESEPTNSKSNKKTKQAML